jgi:hypothetical protein
MVEGLTMASIGFALTQTISGLRSSHPATAAAFALPGTGRRGFPAYYHGTIFRNHGLWYCEGWCPCGCGGVALARDEADGLHRLIHVSPASVTWGRPS